MPGINETIAELNRAFEAFKTANEQRLAAIEKGGSTTDLNAKIEAANKDIDRLQKEVEDAHTKLAASQHGQPGAGLRDKEYTAAFGAHMRKGDVQAALNKGSDENGGYLTPVEWDRTITDRLRDESPMRELAQVITVSKAGFTKLFNLGGTGSGWVGETEARPQTGTPTLASLSFGHGEIYANPGASQQILDDAEIDIEAWLADEVQAEFAEQESAAFISGNGTNKPFGILTYVTGGANAAKHPFGAIPAIPSGAAATISSDSMLDLIYRLKKKYRQSARFLTNNLTIALLRKLKDGQGNYLWQPSAQAGQPATFHGYGISEDENMPDVAPNAIPVLFGDFRRTYLIIDRMGVRVLRDPYTAKPNVLFYTTKRVGGGVQNPEAMLALQVAVAP
ncbi:phage major capsid protein [Corticibacter populi]|uniref:Phage major capsid protein n=1 Tax=Corticibacter populi TaxID=1550736 RepID=A0A3M6QVW7_9BURK|nr:phage major capsid protein [Corticibacter populi]RMX06719.1 phage major capsid protein [Corticibacter populi]RZS31700.1 HK97 family phage major capsid protein [Corticibacter populi]